MARGRPRMSDEEKEAAKAAREASKAIHDWDARLPADPEKRSELIEVLVARTEKLSADLKELRDEAHISGDIKRLVDVFGLRKPAIKIAMIMEKLGSAEEQTAVFRQVLMIGSDRKWDSAPDLFDVAQVGTKAPEEGTIFDKTGAGEAVAAERGDDPGRANKRRGKGEPPPAPVDTGALSPEETERRLREANAASGMAEVESNPEDLRPRFMRENDPTGEGPLPGAGQTSGSYKLVTH
jgi:hypothetical protein